MGRTGVPLSVVTRPPLGGENTGLPSCWGRRTGTGEARGEEEQGQRLRLARPLSLGLIKLGKKQRGI
ncbi:hypothetical protein Acr_07g0006100 [Actinidia rufa]|uniref:Uncharacterized protein n=1 Tax=Actinidia rufa TaxID=165716 RepID=A0A7J0EVH8_9ERIC|nr:hypothetical protein Acr_07g0006100 [Actinidia rufa]